MKKMICFSWCVAQRRVNYSFLWASVQLLEATVSTHRSKSTIERKDVLNADHTKRQRGGRSKSYNDRKKSQEGRREAKKKDYFWLAQMHRRLMESVALPPIKTFDPSMSQKDLQLLPVPTLMSLARSLTQVDKDSMKVIVALWRRLDSMCVEDQITTADIFYANQLIAHWYTGALLSYTAEMFENIHFTPSQLSRLAFHILNHGSAPPSLMLSLEERVSDTMDELTMNEIAVICHVFFIGRNRIRSMKLMDQISEKLLSELHSMNNWYFPVMMKTFRYSNFLKVNFYKRLGNELIRSNYLRLFRTTSQVMHVAFVYASVRITHPDLFQYILHTTNNMSRHRLKDMSKIIWSCGTLLTDSSSHLSTISSLLDKLKSTLTMQNVLEYPDNLAELLVGLAFLGIYPHDLLNILFDQRTLKILLEFDSDREKSLQLHFLHHSVSIECPQYKGNLPNETQKQYMEESLRDFSVENDMEMRKGLVPAITALREAFGSDVVRCTFILPHFNTSDILLIYDKEKEQFVKPEILDSGKLHVATHDNRYQSIALLILSNNQTTYDNKPLGLLHAKMRQLSALNYTIITISAEDALRFEMIDKKLTQEMLIDQISSAVGLTWP